MLPAFIYLAIDYDARGIGVKNSELVFLLNWLSAVSLMVPSGRGVKLNYFNNKHQDVSRVNIAAGQSMQGLPMLAYAFKQR